MSSAAPSFELSYRGRSETGFVRKENQDRIDRFETPFGVVFLLVDGMGGYRGGSIAAEMAVDAIRACLMELSPLTAPAAALRKAAQKANTLIFDRAASGDPAVAKMGSTLVLLLTTPAGTYLVAHAGDSRAYLLRDGRLLRLTKDHSWVQRMVDSRILSEEEARHHPDSGVLTNSLGHRPELDISIATAAELREGDCFLLCSDGLCGYVVDGAIHQALDDHPDVDEAVDALIDLALGTGGHDNVSIQMVRVAVPSSSRPLPEAVAPAPAERAGSASVFWTWIAAGLILMALFYLGAYLGRKSRLAGAPPAVQSRLTHLPCTFSIPDPPNAKVRPA